MAEGEEVLLKGDGDERVYFGVVVEVDEEEQQCLVRKGKEVGSREHLASFLLVQVRFGDCTERWSPFFALRRLDGLEGDQGEDEDDDEDVEDVDSDVPPDLGPPEVDPTSRLLLPPPLPLPASATPSAASSSSAAAQDEDDDYSEVVSEDFGVGNEEEEDDEEEEADFSEEDLDGDVDYEDEAPLRVLQNRKRKKKSSKEPSPSSSKAAPAPKRPRRGKKKKKKKAAANSLPAVEVPLQVLEARKELPYDFDSLVWDANHLRNETERYCYCGESGDWYKKMLQCATCLQWFHQECLRKSATNMLFGDRFFHFVCAICSGGGGAGAGAGGGGAEALKRLNMNWIEALHLVLFNLTVVNNKKYHDLETSILPFIRRKWKSLQGPGGHLKSGRVEPVFVTDLLLKNKTRFVFLCVVCAKSHILVCASFQILVCVRIPIFFCVRISIFFFSVPFPMLF